jgi:ABC-type transport system involved in multi-copper enzyme maturation permease subunit
MRAALRSEFFKQRSIRTGLALLGALLALVAVAVILHVYGFAADDLAQKSNQLEVFNPGQLLGGLFAALLGAMSITSEIRYGTIRPTFLVTPWRSRVVAAKVAASIVLGAGFGLAAAVVATAVGTGALSTRGIDVQLDSGDYALMLAGGAAAAALWAAIGVGVGALVRNQVPALVGLCAWILFVEGLLVGDTLKNVARLTPGGAAAALSGQERAALLPPALALILLALYAAAAALTGARVTARRDVA